MSSEPPSNDLDITLRAFVADQKLFRRYKLIRILGRGGMGVVWLAQDEELELKVALKFLPSLVVHDRALLSDLKRETRRSLELTHNNIVRIYDFVQDEQSACISMEYVDGNTLSELRVEKEAKVFEPSDLLSWVRQACEALEFAHRHARVVHCDIKPSNLMVNSKGTLKIADFGIARSLSDSVSMQTMQRSTTGTLVFMSPQQLDGEGASRLDDIYSLGATLFDLLTGKPPFYRGQIDRQIRERTPPSVGIRRAELDIVGGEPIPAHWEDTIAACLAKDPTTRPQSAIHVAERLESGFAGYRKVRPLAVDTPSSPPIPHHTPGSRSKEKRQTKSIAIAAICFVALISGGVVWYFAFPANKAPLTPAPVVKTSTPSARASPDNSLSVAALSVRDRLFEEATDLRNRGDTTNALARLQDAAQRDPKNANVLAEMAMIYESIQLFERSKETWRKLLEIGPSAGALYELADMKLKNDVTAPASIVQNSPSAEASSAAEQFSKEASQLRDHARAVSPSDTDNMRNDADGIPDGSTFGISEVTATDASDSDAETTIKLKISVKARPNTPIDNTKVKIQVFFYDTVNKKEVALTDADVSYEWITPHHNWKDVNPEILAVTYLRAKKNDRKYLGYIVRIYYDDQLQAVRADPTKLLNLFPPPFTAPSK